MQDQTVPQNFLVTFDPLAGVDPVKVTAPATTSQIADCIQAAFELIDISVGAININLTAGTVAVEDTDGDVIERARIEGPGVGEKPNPTPGPSYFKAVDDLQWAIRELIARDIDDPRGWVALVAAKSGALAAEQNKLVAVGDESESTDPDLRQRLRAELRRIADDIVTRQLPIGDYASLRLGVVDSRADLDPWADYFGTTIDAPDSTDIPSVTAGILLAGRRFGPELSIGVQSPKEERPELEQLRAENARLQALLAEGGTR
ncbi:hypothetical protein AB0C44_08035 [Micromonospora taraxaci]|uniref:hypothetical protein n=1 Tax=Micromonospora taraxaci TaxID=1316803 RepID=UPI003408F6EE